MELNNLLHRLPESAACFLTCADPSASVYTLRLLTEGQTQFQSDILYYGAASRLPRQLPRSVFLNCVVYGEMEQPPNLGDNNSNIAVLAEGQDPFACYNALQSFFIEDQEVTDLVRRMLTAHFSNNGLQYLIDEASNSLNNPIFVIDSSYQYIARHIDSLPEDDSEYTRIMRQEMEYNSILENGVAYIQEHKIDETLGLTDRPYCHYNEYIKKKTMLGAVRIHSIHVAHVMMVEQNHPFTKVDEECFARLVLFVGQEMQKIPLYQKNKGQMYSYFLINLLTDKQPSQMVIYRRLQILHFHLLETFYVVVLQPKSGSFTGQTLDPITDQLHGVLTSNIYALYDGQLVILFNRKRAEPLGEYTEGVLRVNATLNHLSVGISNAFGDLTDIRRFYTQAESAIRYGERFSQVIEDRYLFYYWECSYLEMLDICSHEINLMNYCQPSLLDLMEYDKKSNSELMETFFAYLQNSGNTMRTAKLLCMHKNTLLYRIDRIKTILNNDLASGEDMFMYHLSFRTLIFLGIYTPKIKPQRNALERGQQE